MKMRKTVKNTKQLYKCNLFANLKDKESYQLTVLVNMILILFKALDKYTTSIIGIVVHISSN